MSDEQLKADGWSALMRLEDKITDFMEEAREILREQQRFVSELATRQAVVEERMRRAETDLAVTQDKADTAHRRLDTMSNARAEDIGMRKGMVVGITLASSLGGGSLAVGIAKVLGAFG